MIRSQGNSTREKQCITVYPSMVMGRKKMRAQVATGVVEKDMLPRTVGTKNTRAESVTRKVIWQRPVGQSSQHRKERSGTDGICRARRRTNVSFRREATSAVSS